MVNPYNEIADQIDQKTIGNDKSATPERRQPLAPPNPYEASIKKVEQQRNVLLNRALKRAMGNPPDEIAEVIGLSRATGLNPEIVKGHKQEVEFRTRQRETGAQVAALSHPGQEWLTEKYNLDLSRDDLANIKALDDAIQNRDYYEQTALERNLVSPVRDALLSIRSAFTSQKAAANAPVIPVLEQAEEILQTQGREKAREWAQTDERVRELGIHSNVDYFLRQSEDKRQELLGYRQQSATEAARATVETETERQGLPRNPRLTEAEGFTGVTSAIFNNPEIILQEATRATALSLPMLAMGAATGGVGAAAIGFETERSLEILSRLQKAGVDVTDTDVLLAAFADSDLMEEIGGEAVLKAGGVAAMDLLSFGVAGKLLAPAAIGSRALTGPQRELLNVMAQVPVQSAFEGGGEALGQLLADGEVDGAEVAIEMIAGAATSTPEVAVFGGRRIAETFTRKALDYRTAKRDRAYLTNVKEAVNQTKLQKRDTQALKELVAKLNEQAPAKEVFIGAEDFRELFQSRDMDPDEYAKRMDSVGSQYAEGLAIGSDIAVSMEDFASIIAPLELAEDFIELSRTQPLGMSPAEAEAWMSEEARPALDDVLSAQKDELLASGDRVFQEVTQALTATGMERRTAERNASLYRAFFDVMGQTEDVDPFDLYQQYNLAITREMPEILKRRDNNVDALDPLLDRLRSGDVPSQQSIFGASLTDFLREQGGVQDYAGELSAMDAGKPRQAFQRNLVSEQGLDLATAAERAAEAGYIESRDTNQLLAALDAELRGEPVYSKGGEDAKLQETAADLMALQEELDRLGIDLAEVDNATAKEALNSVVYGDAQQGAEVEFDQAATKTEAFRNWFGDSKAVDQSGNPKVVYHGSPDVRGILSEGFQPMAIRGDVYFFTDSRRVADTYAADFRAFDFQNSEPNTLPVYLSMQNPMVIDAGGKKWRETERHVEEAKAAGHDGIIIKNSRDEYNRTDGGGEPSTVYAVFEPTQIKSAGQGRLRSRVDGIDLGSIENRGTFDPNDTSILNQSAFHGSPHRFDKFSLDAIGTGEGAQAFGWGLYFAGNREIADYYRTEVSKVAIADRFLDQLPEDADYDEFVEWASETDMPASEKEFMEALIADDLLGFEYPAQAINTALKKGNLDRYDPSPRLVDAVKNVGSIYEVEIPDDSDLLDYDKRLNDQPPGITDAVRAITDEQHGEGTFDSWMDANEEGGDYREWRDNLMEEVEDRELSMRLNEKGVPGLRYLDADSRIDSANGQTHNYVIWDDSAVTVQAVNDEMRQAEEMFQDLGGKRGVIRIDRTNRNFNIELLAKADLSTFLHESGHFFLEVLGDLSQREGASDRVKGQYQAILDWFEVESRDQIGVEQHEQFARGFEAYLMEGKAPTPELQSIFSRFRAWLLSIYKRISRLNVQLSDEVRQVMDRMLANDEAIAQAREGAAYSASLADIEPLNWTEQERARYRDLVTQARNDAEETLTRRQMADLDKVNQRWWKQETKRGHEKALKAMNEEMAYVARSLLQKGVMPDGSSLPEPLRAMKLSRQALADMYPADSDVWKQLKAMKGTYIYTRKETGVHPDILAEVLGFGSGDELVRAVIQTQPIADEAQARADAAMKAAYPDLSLSGEASQETVEAIHNEKQAELLLTELKKLHSLGNRTGRPLTPARMLKETAASVIAGTRAKDIRPDLYRRAEAKAGREAFEAAVRQDFEGAYRAKQRQLLNHYLYREARQAQETSEKVYQYAKSFNRKSTRERIAKAGGGYLEQIDAIIDQYEFRRVSVRQLERRQSLRAWSEEQRANDLPVDIPEDVLERSQRVNYRELTMEELQGVSDSIRNIAHVASLKGRLLKDRQKRELEEARRQVVEGITENANRKARDDVETRLPFQEARYMVGNYLASHRRLSSLIREMDGGKDGGTLWQMVMQPLNEAGDLETERTRIYNEALAKLFKQYNPGELSRFYRKEYIPELNYSMSKQGLLMMALNAGTADNWQKLVAGYQQRKGWTEEQMRAAINRLEKRDWEFVQGVLDLVNSLWPDIEAKEKRVKGIAPEKVPAQPIQTPYGTFPGGYFPLTYDERQSEKAYSDRVKEMAEKTMQGAFTAATTKRGFTKARVEGVVLPVRLDFGVIFEHFNEVIHDLTHHEALLDVNRILQSQSVQESIYSAYGNNVYRTMKAAVDDIAAGDVPAIHAHEKALRHLRNGVTIASMGWNIGTAAMQPLGITNSIVRIGPKWVGRGVKRWIGDAAKMENTAAWIFDVSPFMKDRVFTQSREINDIRNQMRGRGKLSWVEDSYFWFITRMQMTVDIPTWLGAYEKAQSEGATEANAISMADQAVIDAQGGGQIKDLAQIQRGHPALKLFTNFISYFVTTWNLMAERYRLNKFESMADAGRFASDFLLLYTVPAVLGYFVSGALRGFGGDDLEDPEEMAGVLAREQLSYMLGGFFGIRELSSGIQGFYGYSGPAGTRFFSEAVSAMNQASQGEADAALAKSLNDMGGILFHYPAGQVERSVEGASLILEGETMNPFVLLTGEKRE